MYGGYYKDAGNEKDGSEKGVVHADMWVLDPRTFEWNKVIFWAPMSVNPMCFLFFVLFLFLLNLIPTRLADILLGFGNS